MITREKQLQDGPLFFVGSRIPNNDGYGYAEMTDWDEVAGEAVIAYFTRQEAEEAAKKFPGKEVIETSRETNRNWSYTPFAVVGM